MSPYARRRNGATRTRAGSVNLSGSFVGHHARIYQGHLNIFRYLRNPAPHPDNNPSGAVQAQLEEKERMDCRRSLSFHDIDARLQNISAVQQGTCDWFFETSLFREWYDCEHDNGLLWIKGNPGTGKSTLMKHILEYCRNAEDYVIAAYFFNARGAELEKTPLGMLRSLLFQLLEHEPLLYNEILPIFRKKQQDYNPGDWEWREYELKSFFLTEIAKCRSRPLLLIIDALDECSKSDVQRVAEFLDHLSTNALEAGITLNICLSSRHYPLIQFKRYQEMVLEKEKQHDKDIIEYISSNLTKRDEAIEEAIKERSSGIFMWVVLVVTMLNTAYDNGKPEAMKQKLNEMPDKLEEVFETLLNGDNIDTDETVLSLQLVLFATQPLTPEEIYFALIAGTNRQALSIWNPLEITPDTIRRRIISSSRGLIEIRKGEEETVQFIHGSVNDFLLRNRRLQRLDPRLEKDPIAESHNRLKDCCMSYLMMESLELPKGEDIGSLESASSVSSLESAPSFPFFQYAASYVFDHAEKATSVGQTELLRFLKDDSVFKRVQRFHNYFGYKDQFSGPLSLLHILAARGLHKLVAILLEEGADINANGRPHRTALEAAIHFEHEKTVKILLDKGAKIDTRGSLFRGTTLKKAFDNCNREILAMLIEKGAKFNIWEKLSEGSVLHKAAKVGDKDVVAMVLQEGAKVNARGPMGTALSGAAMEGKKEIVEMLLNEGAKVNSRGFFGTALMAAADSGNIEIVKTLLERGAKVNARGLMGTALMMAVSGGQKEITEMFLERGAKVNARGILGTALVAAALEGEKEMVQMFLNEGAKINARGIMGTALVAAADNGNIEIVKLLLERGAKVNARGLMGTALVAAVLKGDKEMVQMLLQKGATVNARGIMGTALVTAALEGEKEMVQMFLNEGAKVNARGIMGTALSAAAAGGEREIVEMLLDKGAKINAWGGICGNALHAAVVGGHTEVVEMLIERGANINARELMGPAYLLYRLVDRTEEVPEMLLEKRAKISLWRKMYGTALQAAEAFGQEEVIQLLLEKGAKK